jgi:hypothetical protein
MGRTQAQMVADQLTDLCAEIKKAGRKVVLDSQLLFVADIRVRAYATGVDVSKAIRPPKNRRTRYPLSHTVVANMGLLQAPAAWPIACLTWCIWFTWVR